MKNVLLLAHDDAGQEARFQAALDVARATGGHLTCVDVTWTPPIVSNGFYDNAYAVAEVLTEEVTREAENKSHLQARLKTEDVPWDWIDATGDLAVSLERASALADVIVVSRDIQAGAMPDMLRTAGDLIVRANKPILAVPAECERMDLRNALIAWDGSDEASAALRAATPLLGHAERVTILTVDDRSIKAPAEEAAKYLSRHGIHAAIRTIGAARRDTAEVLLQEITGGDYGYVVMGGFGHARWIESLFGGVTRAMLKQSPVPVLFAH